MRTIAIVNQKGGCGKTTTAINLAGVFAGRGFRTLLVDMDPQGHCAAGLAIPEARIDLQIGDAMLAASGGSIDTTRLLWRVSRNLDLAPSTLRLAALEAPRGELANLPEPERRLKATLARFDSQYDTCLIDCSPAIGLLAFNALVAADEVLIPVETGFFSLQGATKQVQAIKALGKRLGVAPVHRILATMHDPESVLSKDLLEELKRRFASRLVPVVIRFDQALKEAASFGQPVIEYARDSIGAADYGALADWLVANATASSPARDDSSERAESPPSPAAGTPAASPAPHHRVEPGAGSSTSRAADMLSRARKLQARVSEVAIAAGVRSPVDSGIAVEPAPPPGPEQVASSSSDDAIVRDRTEEVARPPTPVAGGGVPFGPQVTPQGVIFRAPTSIGRTVAVAGDFNQWLPDRHPMLPNPETGVLEALAFMPAGSVSQYRLVVDGNWIADPYNPCVAPNPFGGTNSVVAVPTVLMGSSFNTPTVVVRPAAAGAIEARRSA